MTAKPAKTLSPATPAARIGIGFSLLLALLLSSLLLACDPALQALQNSDSLIHVLAAGPDWTPYFWGQDRLGMFYSLPGIPLENPIHKLIFLNSFQIFLFAVTLPVAARWLWQSPKAYLWGSLSALLFLAIIPPHELFLMTVEHPEYAGGLLPSFAALICLERRSPRAWLALPLLLLAAWVNITVPIFLGGLCFLAQLTQGGPLLSKAFLTKAAVLISTMLAVLIPTKLLVATQMNTSLALSPPAKIIEGNWLLWKNAASEMSVIFITGALALVLGSFRSQDQQRKPYLILLLGALGFSFFLSCLAHVGAPHHGLFRSCYQVSSVFLLFLASAPLLGALIKGIKPAFSLPAILLIPLLVSLRTGRPEQDRIVAAFDQGYGDSCRFFLENDITHIGGISWFIYDHLFYCQVLLHQQGRQAEIHAMGFRDSAHRPLWEDRDFDTFRIGVPTPYDLATDPYHLNEPIQGYQIAPKALHRLKDASIHRMRKAEDN